MSPINKLVLTVEHNKLMDILTTNVDYKSFIEWHVGENTVTENYFMIIYRPPYPCLSFKDDEVATMMGSIWECIRCTWLEWSMRKETRLVRIRLHKNDDFSTSSIRMYLQFQEAREHRTSTLNMNEGAHFNSSTKIHVPTSSIARTIMESEGQFDRCQCFRVCTRPRNKPMLRLSIRLPRWTIPTGLPCLISFLFILCVM